MSRRTNPVVAIDGPAGAGKSTSARALATYLGFTHIDSGAMYRALAYIALAQDIPPSHGERLAGHAARVQLLPRKSFMPPFSVANLTFIDGTDRTTDIRTPEIGRLVPQIAALPEVRAAVDARIREIGLLGSVVCDGRDIGTSVFPDAEVKVFLTASLERRAERHHLELATRGVVMNLDQVIDDLRQRDHEDSTRAISPLRQADDAEVLDTTNLNPEEVLAALIRLVREGSPTSRIRLPTPRP